MASTPSLLAGSGPPLGKNYHENLNWDAQADAILTGIAFGNVQFGLQGSIWTARKPKDGGQYIRAACEHCHIKLVALWSPGQDEKTVGTALWERLKERLAKKGCTHITHYEKRKTLVGYMLKRDVVAMGLLQKAQKHLDSKSVS